MSHPSAARLTILGSGTAVPSARRGASGHLLVIGEDRLVFDTGPGTLDRLLRAGVDPHTVGHLFYTHNHLDHTGDLAAWLFAGRVPQFGRLQPLTIAGSPGFMEMLEALHGAYGRWVEPETYRLDRVTLDAAARSTLAAKSWSVQALPVDHIASSIGYRVTLDTGKTFVYTGDTGPCDRLVDLCRDADLLLIETSMPDGAGLPRHLTPSQAGEAAARAGARRVVLTHFYPPCDRVDMLEQLRRTYDGEAALAEDGMTFDL
jgi:ribonuclease BN (tRNA processing enzyme)